MRAVGRADMQTALQPGEGSLAVNGSKIKNSRRQKKADAVQPMDSPIYIRWRSPLAYETTARRKRDLYEALLIRPQP